MVPSETQRVHRGMVVLIALVTGLGAATGFWWWQHTAQRAHGEALFRGDQTMRASLAGQTMPLPSLATRCSNCHETRQPAAFTDQAASSLSARTYASPLSATWLALPRQRHGGPESVYDARSLCKLLREGIDPAMIVVSTVMPRYQASDADCDAMWVYLTSK